MLAQMASHEVVTWWWKRVAGMHRRRLAMMWVEPVAVRPVTCLPLVQLDGQLDSGCATCGADRQV